MGAILPVYERFKLIGLARNGAIVANLVALRSDIWHAALRTPTNRVIRRYPRSITWALRQ